MKHGRRIYATSFVMAMDKIYAYPPPQHSLPHRKCTLHCCFNFPCIDLLGQESYRHHSNKSPSISFPIYQLIAHFTVHEIQPLDEKEICRLCLHFLDTVSPAKQYTRKQLVMMETSIAVFHTILYILQIKIQWSTSNMYKFRVIITM